MRSGASRGFKPGEDHLRADVLLRVEQVVVERVLAPLDTLVLVRGGVRETLRRSRRRGRTDRRGWGPIRVSVVRFGNEAVSAPRDDVQIIRRPLWDGLERALWRTGLKPGNRAGVRSAGEVFRGGGSGSVAGGGGGGIAGRHAGCSRSRRGGRTCLAAAGLGDVALRALGLEDLRACESRHPRWERRG